MSDSQQKPETPAPGDKPPLPQAPQSPEKASPTPPNPAHDYELKSARTLATVATVAGPVSLIIGGVALSTVALVCGIIAFVKVRRVLSASDPTDSFYARALRQTTLMGIVVAAVALVLNGVSVALMMPALIEAMQTGDYTAILGDAAASLQDAPSSGGGSAWG